MDCSLDGNAHLLAIISEVTFVNKPILVDNLAKLGLRCAPFLWGMNGPTVLALLHRRDSLFDISLL